jgi:exopolysaccharide production protein ExoZ
LFVHSIVAIQLLRAVAAISVALCHFNSLELILRGRANDPIFLYPLASGVDLFFVISGFVMVYASEPLFAAPNGSLTFLIRRLARILPLYWVVTAIVIPTLNFDVTWDLVLKSYLFIPFVKPNGSTQPLFGVGWTLNYEMFFYAIFAAALFWSRRTAVALVCALLCGCAIAGWWFSPESVPLRFWSDPIILEFVFGMAIALLYRRRILLPGWARLGSFAAAVAVIWLTRQWPSEYRPLLWGLPAAAIVAAAVLGEQKWEHRLITAWVKRLGDASYSIYLIHALTIGMIYVLLPYGLDYLPINLLLILGFAVTLFLSLALYRYFEKPFTSLARAWLEQRRTLAIRVPLHHIPSSPSASTVRIK